MEDNIINEEVPHDLPENGLDPYHLQTKVNNHFQTTFLWGYIPPNPIW